MDSMVVAVITRTMVIDRTTRRCFALSEAPNTTVGREIFDRWIRKGKSNVPENIIMMSLLLI